MRCRSREGAWIEITVENVMLYLTEGRSREGAWIEMICIGLRSLFLVVAPVRERGLKSCIAICVGWLGICRSREGAWIEMSTHGSASRGRAVAPVRERGLKSPASLPAQLSARSLP